MILIRTRTLRVGLTLVGLIGLVVFLRPGPLHCIIYDVSIFS